MITYRHYNFLLLSVIILASFLYFNPTLAQCPRDKCVSYNSCQFVDDLCDVNGNPYGAQCSASIDCTEPAQFTLQSTSCTSPSTVPLNWTSANRTSSYSVVRNSATIQGGLSPFTQSFTDSAAPANINLDYYIVASNLWGSTNSNIQRAFCAVATPTPAPTSTPTSTPIPTPTPTSMPTPTPTPPASFCGDGICNLSLGESSTTCPSDCGTLTPSPTPGTPLPSPIIGAQSGSDRTFTWDIINPLNSFGGSQPKDIFGVIFLISNWILNIAESLIVMLIIYAGVRFILSRGNPGEVQKAKSILWWALVGFAVILIGKGFIFIIDSVLRGDIPKFF